jgi:peptide/nickel transport system permease protein
MSLLFFTIKRLASAVVVLFAASVLTFLIFFSIPNGNPALRLAGRTATPTDIANVERAYGFDKPIYVQYYRTMKQIFTGSIQSYSQHLPVWGQIRRGLPATLSLSIGAAIIWMIVGIILGLLGARKAGKGTDVAITTASFVGISAPSFVVGNLLLAALVYHLHILPFTGYVPLTQDPWQWFTHLILPWFTLAIAYIGVYAQVLRSSVIEAMNTDAVRTARAKGLSPRRIMFKHILRVSLIPIVSLWGLDFAAVIGGATLIVEVVFNLQGVGQYAAQAVGALDVPPVLTVTILGAFFVVLMNAIVDVFYAVMDPRIRSAGA